MKGFTDKPSYMIELLEGGATLDDVIDGHICEQTLVSSLAGFHNNVFKVHLQAAVRHD